MSYYATRWQTLRKSDFMAPQTGRPNNQPLIVQVLPQTPPGPGRWQPIAADETFALRENMPLGSRDTIIQEAVNVLSRCVLPTAPQGRETGLVIGYVQSGKTLSFTTVAALAHDNHYPIVIVIAGTSIPLFEQSRDRLLDDLGLINPTERRPWLYIENPTVAHNSHRTIQNILDDWSDPLVPSARRKTVLITVMKHHSQLQKLIDVLGQLNLNQVPTLVIDDEGDQAGLNTLVRRGQRSPTYRRLYALKDCLPHHTYLQYTATPQAPLLINIIDFLSPSFAEVLTPGDDYTGGSEFFSRQTNIVRSIPAAQIPSRNQILNAPPDSLCQAMRLFFLGVAVHIATSDSELNRSMMVHPSRLTIGHHQYYTWVSDVHDEWKRILALPEGETDRADLLNLFRGDYNDLQRTKPDIPAFEHLATYLPLALRRTNVREINYVHGQFTPVNWNQEYWILVGGQAMDRGFTVRGLTVTYMPRGVGVGNVDTVQQRARFFGYKRSYLGLCRVFLENTVRDLYESYVLHEEDMRRQLIEHNKTGRPLSDWRRQFFLNRNLRPTRDAVIDIAYQRAIYGDDWVYPQGLHDTPEALAANRIILEQFRSGLRFVPHDGLDLRKDSPRNMVARNIRLQAVHEELLARISLPRLTDSLLLAPLLRLIQIHLLNNPDELCTVFLMANGQPRRRAIINDEINELFQGRQYAQNTRGQRVPTYPGDRAVRADLGLSVQLRYLNLGPSDDQLIAENVPHIAVWVPSSMAQDLLRQPQGGPHP